ncbi:MAG: 4Fe-4S binding protein [Ignisphaera sp.]|nr:4Fe-4S binding protein [Ignisphaera sp.]MCX8168177.1 4Fe-4S binding protein [Ignisphaera sp.]MDW8085183.1 4Fe-4S binding protein [Ignisphaera sp.]
MMDISGVNSIACKPKIDYVACNCCTTCVELCLHGAIYIDRVDGYVKINYAKCRNCGVCIKVCPYGAIKCFDNRHQWVPTTSSTVSAD